MVKISSVVLLGTLDTKGEEFKYLKEILEGEGLQTIVVDVGTKGEPYFAPDIESGYVAQAAGADITKLSLSPNRGEAIKVMLEGAAIVVGALHREGKLSGIMGMGGSGGTTIATAAMRPLPYGVPKIMVSTLASGDTSAYVGISDLIMVPSVTDVAGLNRVSRQIIWNAAMAMVGMVKGLKKKEALGCSPRPTVGATMLGLTTKCLEMVRQRLENEGYEVLTFHANGTGGRAMEKFAEAGELDGLIELNVVELANEIFGGAFAAGASRFEVAAKKGIPQVVCLGGADLIIFNKSRVPAMFARRRFLDHSPTITLMRTNKEENHKLGVVLAEKLNRSCGPIALVIPSGFSALDVPGGEFYGPEEDKALVQTILTNLRKDITVVKLKEPINSPVVADNITRLFLSLMQKSRIKDEHLKGGEKNACCAQNVVRSPGGEAEGGSKEIPGNGPPVGS